MIGILLRLSPEEFLEFHNLLDLDEIKIQRTESGPCEASIRA